MHTNKVQVDLGTSPPFEHLIGPIQVVRGPHDFAHKSGHTLVHQAVGLWHRTPQQAGRPMVANGAQQPPLWISVVTIHETKLWRVSHQVGRRVASAVVPFRPVHPVLRRGAPQRHFLKMVAPHTRFRQERGTPRGEAGIQQIVAIDVQNPIGANRMYLTHEVG